MIYTLLGDIHGNKEQIRRIADFNNPVIQVGDFDLHGYKYENYHFKNKVYFIDGNHENFPSLQTDANDLINLQPNLFYIPRGYINNGVLFIGGANSIDKGNRVEGFNWFPEEVIGYKQANDIFNRIEDENIHTIISHDCPDFVYKHMNKDVKTQFITPIFLNDVFETVKPKTWIYGHHHMSFDKVINDTRFICLNINQTMELDLPCILNGIKINNEFL